MPSYRFAKRVITIYLQKERGGVFEIHIAPDPAEVVQGDDVVWQVQGAPPFVSVGVGNFTRLDPPARVRITRDKIAVVKPKAFPIRLLRANPAGVTIPTRRAEPGFYKYDILINGRTVLDPDIEIKRPSGGGR